MTLEYAAELAGVIAVGVIVGHLVLGWMGHRKNP
jgi:hypothetical protein